MKTKNEFMNKYIENINGISKAVNVDQAVSTDMLLFLAKALSDLGDDYYPGVGLVNLDNLVSDYRDLKGSWIDGRE